MPFFAEKVGKCQLGSRVSLGEGSLVIHSVIPAFPGKGSKGCQRALSHKLLNAWPSAFSFCCHLALQVTLENIKHVLFIWMFFSPDLSWGKFPTPSHQLKSFTWIADDDSEQSMSLLLVTQPHPAETLLLRTQRPAQATRHMLCPLLLSLPRITGCPKGGRCA